MGARTINMSIGETEILRAAAGGLLHPWTEGTYAIWPRRSGQVHMLEICLIPFKPVERLRKAGLIARAASETFITEAGRRMLAQVDHAHEEAC